MTPLLLSEISDSYYFPTPENAARSKGLIAKMQAELDHPDTSMDGLDAHLTELQRHITVHQSSISLIRGLPTEILTSIFSFSLERHMVSYACDVQSDWWNNSRVLAAEHFSNGGLIGRVYVDNYSRRLWRWEEEDGGIGRHVFGNPRSSPWSISAVCKRWRDIAISTPNLWSNIQIYFPHGDSEDAANSLLMLPRLSLTFQRSEPLGLDITILSRDFLPGVITVALGHQHHRWENLVLYSREEAIGRRLVDYNPDLPRLKSIAASCDMQDFLKRVKAPALESLYGLQVRLLLLDALHEGLPGIRSVSTTCIKDGGSQGSSSIYSQVQGLSRLSSLENLQVLVWAPTAHRTEDYVGAPLKFPKLTTLVVGASPTTSELEHGLLHIFSAPCLKLLRIVAIKIQDTNPIVSFIERSHCTLTSLHVFGANWGSSQIHDVLDVVPHLETLFIRFFSSIHDDASIGRVDNTILHRLFAERTSTDHSVCSYLRTVTLLNAVDLDVELAIDLLFAIDDRASKRMEVITLSHFGIDPEMEIDKRQLIQQKTGCRIILKPWDPYFEDSGVEDWFATESEAVFTDSDEIQSSEESSDEVEVEDVPEYATCRLLDSDDSDLDSEYSALVGSYISSYES